MQTKEIKIFEKLKMKVFLFLLFFLQKVVLGCVSFDLQSIFSSSFLVKKKKFPERNARFVERKK